MGWVQTFLQIGWTILHSHQWLMTILFASCSCQHLELCLILAILMCTRHVPSGRYFIVVLLCISLMINSGHVFTCLPAIHMWPVKYGHISLWGIQIFYLLFFFSVELCILLFGLFLGWLHPTGKLELLHQPNSLHHWVVVFFKYFLDTSPLSDVILWIYSSRIYSQSVDFCFLHGVMESSPCLLKIFVRLHLIESTGEIIWARSLL